MQSWISVNRTLKNSQTQALWSLPDKFTLPSSEWKHPGKGTESELAEVRVSEEYIEVCAGSGPSFFLAPAPPLFKPLALSILLAKTKGMVGGSLLRACPKNPVLISVSDGE